MTIQRIPGTKTTTTALDKFPTAAVYNAGNYLKAPTFRTKKQKPDPKTISIIDIITIAFTSLNITT